MIIISHRANLYGPDLELENTSIGIRIALELGFDVEIDVWNIHGAYYLGHDEPKEKIDKKFLLNDKLWCHAKNIDSMEAMIKDKINHFFYHDKDLFTITSKNFPIAHCDIQTENTISVIKNKPVDTPKTKLGIMTDYPIDWKNFLIANNLD